MSLIDLTPNCHFWGKIKKPFQKIERLDQNQHALASWGLAFFKYMLQVPANRIGSEVLSTYQLKIMQEAISLVVFVIFAALYFGEVINLRYGVSLGLIFAVRKIQVS